MPAKIIHPKHPKHPNHPNVSVVIPTLLGDEKKLAPLLSQIKKQTEKNIEIILSINEKPNGHARNVGVKKAKGKYLICLDDDITLDNNQIFHRLIKTLEIKNVGLAGSAVLLPKDSNWIAKRYNRLRKFEIKPVRKIIDGKASHACLALETKLYRQIGGESDVLVTGTDDDLRYRIKKAGLRIVVAPKTLVYHACPSSFKEIRKGSFNKGIGSAFALKNAPHIFPFPKVGPLIIKRPLSVLLYFILTLPLKIILTILTRDWVLLIVYFYQTIGLVIGYFRHHRQLNPNPNHLIQIYAR